MSEVDPIRIVSAMTKGLSEIGIDPQLFASDILSGNVGAVVNYCFALAGEQQAAAVSEDLAEMYHSVSAFFFQPAGLGGHAYIERASDKLLIDPTALQFFAQLPRAAAGHFWGTMFVGTRENLHRIVLDPETRLHRITTSENKDLSFKQIWGKK